MQSQHRSVLRRIVTRLEKQPLNWAITGSLGFALQGVEVAVNDIDLQTDRESAYAIERLFADHMTRSVAFSAVAHIRSHFGAFELEGVQVEIMGDIQKKLADGTWEAPVNPRDHRAWVMFEGMQVPVLSLAYEYRAYLKLGRLEKAALLKRYLENERDD